MTDEPMHDHNLDLIMALAEGALSGADLEAAEAEIAACEGCAVELAAQRLALDVLQSAPAPEMTELEAARMRRTLRDELGLVDPEPIARPGRSRSWRWQRVSVGLSVAAVLLLFVAVVPALDLFGAGSADDAANVAFAPQTTAAPAVGGAVSESAADTTAAPATTAVDMSQAESADGVQTTTTMTAPLERLSFSDFGSEPNLEDIKSASQRGLIETGDAANLLGLSLDLDGAELDDRVELCKADGLEVFAAGRVAVELGSAVILDGDVFIIAYVNAATGDVQIVAHDADGCAVITSSS